MACGLGTIALAASGTPSSSQVTRWAAFFTHPNTEQRMHVLYGAVAAGEEKTAWHAVVVVVREDITPENSRNEVALVWLVV